MPISMPPGAKTGNDPLMRVAGELRYGRTGVA
jgi:hypothetical protein